MRRRRFVATTGTALGTVTLAGCVADDDDDDSNGEEAANGDDEGNGDDEANGAGFDPDELDGDPPTLDRVDTPPHDPERPPSEDAWDPHWPGEGMDTESPVEFEPLGVEPTQSALELDAEDTRSEFVVTLVDSTDAAESWFDQELDDVDFESETVVVVESGYGSSSVGHEWVRVEGYDSGLHLHGYYRTPYVQTTDITTWQSALVVEIPAPAVEEAHASITVDEDRRVNLSTQDGVVRPDE